MGVEIHPSMGVEIHPEQVLYLTGLRTSKKAGKLALSGSMLPRCGVF
jgi:hypothetical protein